MTMQGIGWAAGLCLLATVLSAAPASHAPDIYVPPALEPWRAWVLEQHREQSCPPLFSDASVRPCVWIRRLEFVATESGANFSLDVEVFARADVVIPGDAEHWPVDVLIDGRSALVTQSSTRPRLQLEAGGHTITGRSSWTRMPDSIAVPRHHGLLRLSIDGRTVSKPLVEGDRLWLGRSAAAGSVTANDSLEVRVFRRVNDGVPLTVDTIIELSVAGSHRIEKLGRALPEGFLPTALTSAVPARIDGNGELSVQVEPGEWPVTLSARALTPINSLRASPATGPWPTQEIWGFAASRSLRVVEIEGVTAIDLSQTDAPFQDLPGYLVAADSEFRLVEQFRGDPNPAPNDYSVSRRAWLAFDGDRIVMADTLGVIAQRPSRLTASFVPGRVTVDGVPQLITAIGDKEPGIELPQGQYQVESVTEIERDAFEAVLGWRVDASSMRATLQLPPGWRLLWTRGVDSAPAAWLARWNVWNLFLVLITVAMALRLLGVGGAVLAAATLVVIYHEPNSPTFSWIVLLVLLAGVRITRAGILRRLLNGAYAVVFAATLVATIGFAIDGFRKAIHPQLERPSTVVEPQGYEVDPLGARAPSYEESIVTEAAMSQSDVRESRYVAKAERKDLYPAGLSVQTGPAIPSWSWNALALEWHGPVTAAQRFDLALSPPWLTRGWYVLGPVLLMALLLVFGLNNAPTSLRLPPQLARFVRSDARAGTASLLLTTILLGGMLSTPPVVAAEFPGPDMLGELERRLTAAPECMPGCASFERVRLTLDERALTLEIVVHADVTSAVPLPGGDKQWVPTDVRIGGRPATLRRDDAGQLLIALPAGRNSVALSGSVVDLERFELPFPLAPGQLDIDLDGWTAYGIEEGRLRGSTLQFVREVRSEVTASSSLRPDPIVPYYGIERELRFGLEWRATTTVRRIAPAAGVIPFSVPLLAGESILSGQVTTDHGQATGVLPPDEWTQSYESTLTPIAELALTAPPLATASEIWTVVPSNQWHVEFAGLPPTKVAPGEAPGPRFHPLPGETLTLRLSQPTSVPGDSVTVEHVRLTEAPGQRARRATLTLELLSSQGGNFPITLPPDTQILEITHDGRPEPIPLVAGPLPLPIVPGNQTISITWESPRPVELRTRTTEIRLPTIGRNIELNESLPADRWPLFVGGPALGPAVLYWGVLAVVVLLALALARVPGLPLTATDAVLLGLGMSLCNLPGTVIVAVWLLVLLARRQNVERLASLSSRRFQLLQVTLALFSIAAVISLTATVPFGLLGAPDMQIVGNESTAYDLRWFQDQAAGEIPGAWVISLPLWVYRIAMLAWSLWLAFALVRWARWAWASYAAGGAWRSARDRLPAAGEGAATPQ